MTTAADIDLSGYLPPQAPTPKKSHKWLVISLVTAAILIPLLVAVVLRVFVIQTFFIPSGSMAPTLHIGDRILVDRLSYDFGPVHRGDIVVFSRPPAENCGGTGVNDLVKRVVGLPGDAISLKGGFVYVDGRKLNEPWLPKVMSGTTVPGPSGTPYDLTHQFVVPKNRYYVLGDNRGESCDSRYWGTITKSELVGKVVVRVWPTNRIGVF